MLREGYTISTNSPNDICNQLFLGKKNPGKD